MIASPRWRTFLAAGAVVAWLAWPVNLAAQCAMCKTALTNSSEGQRWARGINGGIMLLLLAPFLIVGVITLNIYARHLNACLRQMYRRCKKRLSKLLAIQSNSSRKHPEIPTAQEVPSQPRRLFGFQDYSFIRKAK